MSYIAWLPYLSIIQIIFGLSTHLRSGLFDFDIYYQYAKLLTSGLSPFNPQMTNGIPFNYPPSSFILFAPLSLLPRLTSSLIFTGFSILFFLISMYQILKQYCPSKPLRLFLLILFLQNFPTKFTLVLGQVNLIVLCLLLISFYFDRKNRQGLAGLFWGVSGSLKLTPLTIAFYFLLRKKYTSFLVGITTFIAINLIVLILAPDSFYYFKSHLPALISKTGNITTLYDQSIRAFFSRLQLPQSTLLSYFSVIVLFILISLKNRKLSDLSLFSLILIVTTIGNSFAWQHHFVFTFPGLVAVFERVYKKRSIWLFALTLASFFLIAYHFPDISHPPTTNPFLVSHTLIGTLILIGLLLK